MAQAQTTEAVRSACEATVQDYAAVAAGYAAGNLQHDVSQNIEAALRGRAPPLAVLDLGCAGGRDLVTFTRLGHRATGVAGSDAFAAIARQTAPEATVLASNLLDLDLGGERFDAIYANAVLFHLPSAALPALLSKVAAALRTDGVFFASNAHGFGEDKEGWTAGRTPATKSYVSWLSEETWCSLCRAAGLELLELYYRPPGLPRERQPFLCTAWRVANPGAKDEGLLRRDPPGHATAVVFLDVDGVLANARSVTFDFEAGDPTLVHDPLSEQAPLERRCLLALADVARRGGGAEVVLTTTWRLDPAMRTFLISALSEVAGVVVRGDTPNLKGAGRGAEVREWLQRNPAVRSFVIVDDSHVASFEAAGLGDHFVQTTIRDEEDSLLEGLTESAAERAVQVLLAGACPRVLV